MQQVHSSSPMSVHANSSLRHEPTYQLAGMSSPQPPITVTLLDGVVRAVAPLGPVWGAFADPAGLRALADLVSRSLESSRLREHLAHWIVEREDARATEAEAAKARKAAPQEKERQGSGITKRLSASVTRGSRKISMPPASAPAAAVYAAFARAAGSDSARRAAYRLGRQSVWAAERAVEELVDREYQRLRSGEHKGSVDHFEAALGLREGEELETLEKVHVVMSVRRVIADSPPEKDTSDDDEFDQREMLAAALAAAEEAGPDDQYDDHYWTPDESQPNRELLEVVASSSLRSLLTLAEHFDPLRVGLALVRPVALPAYMEAVRKIVLGRGKARGGAPGVLGKPDRPWFDSMYDFAMAISIVGSPHLSKQGSRLLKKGKRRRKKAGRSAHRPGQNSDAFRRKLFLGMHDLADEPHDDPTPGDHRLIDRLRADERPVLWSAKKLRERRVEHARHRIRHVIDEFPSAVPFSVAEIIDRSNQCRSRVDEMIEELILAGGVKRLARTE